MKTMTQRQQVLRHLQENGSITSWEAIMKFHATRLSGIIYSLRKGLPHCLHDGEQQREALHEVLLTSGGGKLMRVEFTVLGEPKGKGRPQFSTYGGRITTRTPKDTVIYENLVRMEYQRQCGKARFAEKVMLRVEVTAYYGIPKSASQKKEASDA